jgi:hypothetical protein
MNPARRERQIDRATADEIPGARIGPALVKLDDVAAPAQIRRKHSAGKTATNQDKLCSHAKKELTGLTGFSRFT